MLARSTCLACGAPSRRSDGECLACGAELLVPLEALPSPRRAPTMADAPPLRLIASEGAIAAACGGTLCETGTILVTGKPGSRKSTHAAALLLELHRRGWRALFVDAEMHIQLARAVFERVGATHAELGELVRTEARSAHEVLEAISVHRPRVVVVDSLHMAARRARAQEALLEALCREGRERLVIVVAHANRTGQAHGGHAQEHPGDAVVVCERDGTARAVKCRWHAC